MLKLYYVREVSIDKQARKKIPGAAIRPARYREVMFTYTTV